MARGGSSHDTSSTRGIAAGFSILRALIRLLSGHSAGSIDPGGGGVVLPCTTLGFPTLEDHSERILDAAEQPEAEILLREQGGGSTFMLFSRRVKIVAFLFLRRWREVHYSFIPWKFQPFVTASLVNSAFRYSI